MKFIAHFRATITVVAFILVSNIANANEVALFFGLSQPILFRGYNVEVNYLTENWVFEYSHGWDLKISDYEAAMTNDEKSQNLKIRTPYTTGGGVGYRFTPNFHLALEIKQHEFEVTHPVDGKFKYVTQTVGLGAYYIWRPIAGSGLTIMPALRFWPTVNTSLDGNKKTFSNGEVHEAHNFDLAPNIKIGWAF